MHPRPTKTSKFALEYQVSIYIQEVQRDEKTSCHNGKELNKSMKRSNTQEGDRKTIRFYGFWSR
jgi:hypothetical protein